MGDIDLIPEYYRTQRQFKKWFKQFVSYFFVLLILLAGTYSWLRIKTSSLNNELQALQLKNNIAMQKKKQYEEELKQKTELQQQLDLLNGLRSGVTVLQTLQAMDRAFKDTSIWFTHWKYMRSEYLMKDNNSAMNSVYFMITTDKEKKQQQKWGIKIHMNIKGAALDHATLSDFIRRLIKQPEIQKVRVVHTDRFILKQKKLVRFIIEVFMNTDQVADNG